MEVNKVKPEYLSLSRISVKELSSKFHDMLEGVLAIEAAPKDREGALERREAVLRIMIVRIASRCHAFVICSIVYYVFHDIITHLKDV